MRILDSRKIRVLRQILLARGIVCRAVPRERQLHSRTSVLVCLLFLGSRYTQHGRRIDRFGPLLCALGDWPLAPQLIGDEWKDKNASQDRPAFELAQSHRVQIFGSILVEIEFSCVAAKSMLL